MSSEASKTQATAVKCPKCGRVNGPDQMDCGACGEHLYLHCRHCKARNARVRERCVECGHRLHRSSHDHGWDSDAQFKFLLVVVVLVALYFLVRWLAAPPGFPALPPAEPAH